MKGLSRTGSKQACPEVVQNCSFIELCKQFVDFHRIGGPATKHWVHLHCTKKSYEFFSHSGVTAIVAKHLLANTTKNRNQNYSTLWSEVFF